jgi:hypothetical protein
MNGGWVWETSPVVQTAVASDPKNGMFYGALAPDGTLYGKQGLEGSWTKLTSDVRQFSVASDPVNGLFVAAVKTDGSVHGKQGMHGGWTRLTAGAKQVAISSDSRNGLFVGVVFADGVVQGKQGMNGGWTRLTSGATQVAVTSDPVNGVFYATRHSDGVVSGKQGMHGGWTTLTEGAKQVAIASDSRNGLFVGVVNNSGVVHGKQGMHGSWVTMTSYSVQIALPGDSSVVPVTLPLAAQPTPTVSGKAQVGQTLSAQAGEWKPSPVTLSYQWLREGSAISGATKSTYTLVAADVGKKVSVKVTGSKAGYTTVSKTSAPTVAVAAAPSPKPTPSPSPSSKPTPSPSPSPSPEEPGKEFTAVSVPKVTGSVKVGKRLTADPGAWGPGEVALSYQWFRSGVKIAKATKATYKLVAADRGKTLTVKVTGTKSGYATVSKTSVATGKVAAGSLTSAKPKITGTVKVGKKLTAKPGVWKPSGVKVSYQWLRSGKAIKGATKPSYKLTSKDKRKKITVKVTGKKAGYASKSVVSKATKKVG